MYFWFMPVDQISTDHHSGFTLHTIARLHRPELNNYYGFICHLAPTTPLAFTLRCCTLRFKGYSVRLPQLLHRLPARYPTLNHSMDLTKYRASRYLARLPIHIAESGSLSLCTPYFLWLPSDPAVSQQRPCHSDCLPLSQGDSGFFQPDGFASFAGQTRKPGTSRA